MRGVILGGTGAIGGAVAARLAAAGVRFHQVERSETSAIERLVGGDADPYWSIYSPTGVRMSGPYCP